MASLLMTTFLQLNILLLFQHFIPVYFSTCSWFSWYYSMHSLINLLGITVGLFSNKISYKWIHLCPYIHNVQLVVVRIGRIALIHKKGTRNSYCLKLLTSWLSCKIIESLMITYWINYWLTIWFPQQFRFLPSSMPWLSKLFFFWNLWKDFNMNVLFVK